MTPERPEPFSAYTTPEFWDDDHISAQIRLVLNRYTIVAAGVARQYWNWMACMTTDEVADELAAAGFGPPGVYGDVTGAPYDPTSPVFAVVTART